jgi:hypothetical protein
VTAVYQQLLGRTPDATGLNYWGTQLGQSLDPSQFVSQIAGSPEFIARQGGLDPLPPCDNTPNAPTGTICPTDDCNNTGPGIIAIPVPPTDTGTSTDIGCTDTGCTDTGYTDTGCTDTTTDPIDVCSDDGSDDSCGS